MEEVGTAQPHAQAGTSRDADADVRLAVTSSTWRPGERKKPPVASRSLEMRRNDQLATGHHGNEHHGRRGAEDRPGSLPAATSGDGAPPPIVDAAYVEVTMATEAGPTRNRPNHRSHQERAAGVRHSHGGAIASAHSHGGALSSAHSHGGALSSAHRNSASLPAIYNCSSGDAVVHRDSSADAAAHGCCSADVGNRGNGTPHQPAGVAEWRRSAPQHPEDNRGNHGNASRHVNNNNEGERAAATTATLTSMGVRTSVERAPPIETAANPHALPSTLNTGIVLRPIYSAQELPDILNSHMRPPPRSQREDASQLPRAGMGGGIGLIRTHRNAPSMGVYISDPMFDDLEPPKGCCGEAMNQTIGMRWFVIFVGMIGLLCIVIGIILGVLGGVTVAGSEYVTVALLLI
ncbi:PREDICTED: uncharacterized protein LOC106817113, partial [Priapulus caudatus]|uniref:Uncharacterized protein LOC106817113 n=1 Tax=Priapulus caudatus TaxID=37621 RepID=A0ABM1EYH8_PRICU